MPVYSLELFVDGLDLDDEHHLDRLHTDTFVLVPGTIDGVTSLTVEVEAVDSEDAVRRVLGHLAESPWIIPVRLDLDLVNASGIAERLNVSREAVRLWATKARAVDDFPGHWTIVGAQKLWAWADVHGWALVHEHLTDAEPRPLDIACVERFNARPRVHRVVLAAVALRPS